MEEKQIYVSFFEDEYRFNKKELLISQKDILNIQKRLRSLAAIRSQKKRLFSHLANLTQGSSSLIQKLDSKMPDGTMPKGLKITEKRKFSKTKIKHDFSSNFEVDDLDKELLEIQKKLEQLTGK